MNNYSRDYFITVKNGLDHMVVTDRNGKVLSHDDGLETWADKSEELKNKRGIFFFCGNGASATMAEHLSHDCFQNADFLTETCSRHRILQRSAMIYHTKMFFHIGSVRCSGRKIC